MSYYIANRQTQRIRDMIDGLPASHKQCVEEALDDLERTFDPRNPPQKVDLDRYRIYAADGDVEIVFKVRWSSNSIEIETIRKRSRLNKILRAIGDLGLAPKGS
jgi:hypothetical protein